MPPTTSQATGTQPTAPRQAVLDRIDQFQSAMEHQLDQLAAAYNRPAPRASVADGSRLSAWLLSGVVMVGGLVALLVAFAR